MTYLTKLYLAAPFFNDAQTTRLNQVAAALQQNPTVSHVFSPMNDTNAAGLTFGTPEWQQLVYNEDTQGLNEADVLLAVYDYDHANADPGTMFEIGYAVAKQIPVVVFCEGSQPINLMISQGLTTFTQDLKTLTTLDFTHLPHLPYTGEVY